MIGRPFALAGLLGAAVGGPYVLSQAPDGLSPWGQPAPEPAEVAAATAPADPLALRPPDVSSPVGPGSQVYQSPAPLEGPVGLSLEQALDWSIDRNWVYARWARKSTGLADPQLFGVRVPLVTGSGMTDVAGSLAYYFDNAGVLQRMRLHGRTADTSRIVHLATTRFGMQAQNGAPGDQLFRSFERKELRGELRTRPEGTLWATSPHSSFAIDLDVTRPGGPYLVRSEAPRLEIPAATPPPAPAGGEGGGAASDAALRARVGGPPAPTLPKVGAPEAAPRLDLKPLQGHRDQFRWPD